MKKILLLILTASLFIACEKTNNEQGLVNVFIGYADGDSLPDVKFYENVKQIRNEYIQDFNDKETSEWGERNDKYAIQTIKNGILMIQAKQNFFTWVDDISWNSNYNYQMEAYVHIDFSKVNQNEMQGFLFGIDNETFNFFTFVNQTKYPLAAGYYDSVNYNYWYRQETNIDMSGYHLFTIRKFADKMYLYIDKELKCEMDYKDFEKSYGFLIAKDGIISVDYVRIDYIDIK